jgi:hypothetical protein
MVLIPFALAAGLLLGLLRGGKPENLLGFGPSLWPLGIIGLTTLLVGEFGSLERSAAIALFIGGSIVLLFFLAKNTRFKGSIIIALGLALNVLAAVANGHVPVRYDALVSAGEVSGATQATDVSLTGLREMEDAETRLSLLGEVVPLEILNAAVSFGDLILAAGVTVFAMHLLLARRRRGIDVDDLLGPEVFIAPTPDVDLRMTREIEPEIDLRPAEPKLVPAASDEAQVLGPDESNFNRPTRP